MSQQNAEIVRRWWAGFNEDGLPPFDLCDERIEIRNPTDFPFKDVYRGHDGVRRWRAEVFDDLDTVENVRVEVDDLIDAPDGETVVMALRFLLRLKRFEMDHEMTWAAVWIIRHGKLVWAQGYVHMADALEAVGLSEQDARAES